MQQRGRFISLEGGEGVGKSTLSRHLHEFLTQIGCKVIVTREPGGTRLADQIRQIFLNPPEAEEIYPLTEFLLVSAARHQHIRQVIEPALQRGDWVICDRFADSSRVYQVILRNLDRSWSEALIAASTENLVPDLTLLLDCAVELSHQRLSERQSQQTSTRFDIKDAVFHQRVREGFLELSKASPERILRLDAQMKPQMLVDEIQQSLERRGWLT